MYKAESFTIDMVDCIYTRHQIAYSNEHSEEQLLNYVLAKHCDNGEMSYIR